MQSPVGMLRLPSVPVSVNVGSTVNSTLCTPARSCTTLAVFAQVCRSCHAPLPVVPVEQVYRTICALGVPCQLEHNAVGEYSIDVAIPEHRIAGMPACSVCPSRCPSA